ncbi:GlcG/HbpS family heme-binding protein [Amycolatopsis pithecellobii]|uniref:Heme-binding protein n=1 Tax=Amycolatopsis pithecellobii TaxID=664692 RepID=A0A6N7Z006_9PSEU|nr:heme-binding protein [Amycolatopsis pithecellobii]MTD54563.1 heme-binding protein [Amycolatopsis pithecellobii]
MAPIRQVPTITNAAARQIVDAAVTAAAAAGQRSAIAVVDAAGQLSAFTRMDGAPPQAIQIAQDKAYTAAGFGMPTGQWHDFMTNDSPLAMGAPGGIARLIPFGGGLPIIIDGHAVGGIGVSGGHWTDDTKVAEAAINAIG